MLAPLLFNIFFEAMIHVAYSRFEGCEDIMDVLLRLRKKTGAGGNNGRRASPYDVTMGHAIR